MTDFEKPVVVTVVSSSIQGTGTGNGLIETPKGRADILVKVIHPLTLLAVRCLRVYLQSMLSVMTAGPVTGLIPAKDFLHLVLIGASVGVGAAGICLVQNAIELLGSFDQSHPKLTA